MAGFEFVIGGMQKSGTTALALYLQQHEQIYIPPEKELHIFRGSPLKPITQAYVRKRFKNAPLGLKWGDASPLYTYWPYCLELMRDYNPNMKIIISLRHPVLRAYSSWSMEIRREREDKPFSWCIRQGRERVRQSKSGVHLTYSYVERGFYLPQIENLLSIFSKNQIFFIRSDQIEAQHKKMQDILSFLKVTPMTYQPLHVNVHPSSLNSRPDNLIEDFQYLHALYEPDFKQLSKLTGLDLSDWHKIPPLPDGDLHSWRVNI